jgi:hypothetical protein
MDAFRPKLPLKTSSATKDGSVLNPRRSTPRRRRVAVLDQGRFANAVDHFRQSLAMKPASAAAHYNLDGADDGGQRDGRSAPTKRRSNFVRHALTTTISARFCFSGAPSAACHRGPCA